MRKPIRRALVSVYDKTRLIEVGSALHAAGVEILSTGSTAKNLADAGIPVIEVSQYTGFPEIMGGRVKTLHPRIHSGILADQNNPEHLEAIKDLDGEITVLIIAHRLTTLRNCDKVVKLDNNHALSVGSYKEMVNK